MTTMSDFILPPGLSLPESMLQQKDTPEEGATNEEKGKSIPKPTGWKVLCVVPPISDKYENTNIVRPDSYMRAEELGTVVLFVVELGDLAYKDDKKFPTGAWCKKGDFVLTRTYAGTRFKIFGTEFRLLNDDQIEAVVDDPRGVQRAQA